MRRSHVLSNVLTIVLLLAATTSTGCTDIKKIPLFNEAALPMNRVASGNEVLIELEVKVADYVQRGWISRQYRDDTLNPLLDNAGTLLSEARVLLRNNDESGGKTKIEAAEGLLRQLREQLAMIERTRR